MDPHSRPAADPQLSPRWIIGGIMSVLTLWGAYLARGAFLHQRNLIQGSLVFVCVLGFLAFWSLMLVVQTKRPGTSKYSHASLAGFACGLIALLLTMPASFLTQPVGGSWNVTRPAAALLGSAVFVAISVLFSIIGLSRPQQQIGKNLGYLTLPIAIVWLCFALRLASQLAS